MDAIKHIHHQYMGCRTWVKHGGIQCFSVIWELKPKYRHRHSISGLVPTYLNEIIGHDMM